MDKLLLIMCLVAYAASQNTGWDRLDVTFGTFSGLPITTSAAIKGKWNQIGSCKDTGVNFKGDRFIFESDPSVMLLFDVNGKLAGIQSAINNTVPNSAIFPPFESSNDKYIGKVSTLTAYITNPATICSTPVYNGTSIGDRLWVQTGSNSYLPAPIKSSDAVGGGWTHGKCFVAMGDHYWRGISSGADCHKIFPMFLLYNHGILNGFGWAFSFGPSQPGPRWEHPAGSVLKAFFQEESMPQCILTQSDMSTVHFYFTNPAGALCLF